MADSLSTYARTWRGVWAVVVLLGIGLALIETPRGIVPVAFPVVFCLALCLRFTPLRTTVRARPGPLAFVATGALGYAALSRPVAVLLALLAVVTMPAVVSAALTAVGRDLGLQRRHRVDPRTSGDASDAPPARDGASEAEDGDETTTPAHLTVREVRGPLVGLDDRQLCRLWRESLWKLRGQASGESALRIVLLRQACLDELTRRHGPGVEAWLASGARASSGPERFLDPPQAS